MSNLQNELSLTQRLTTPAPKLFKNIRNAGIILAAVAGGLMGIQEQGVELPHFLTLVANFATLIAGTVASLVSSLTVDVDQAKKGAAL